MLIIFWVKIISPTLDELKVFNLIIDRNVFYCIIKIMVKIQIKNGGERFNSFRSFLPQK